MSQIPPRSGAGIPKDRMRANTSAKPEERHLGRFVYFRRQPKQNIMETSLREE